jgi:hypothetical protein
VIRAGSRGSPASSQHQSIDEFYGGGSYLDIWDGTRTPPMRLFHGVADGLVSELRRYCTNNNLCIDTVSVRLYTHLRITVEDSTQPFIYHCAPDVDSRPWYDTVLYQALNEVGEEFTYAGRLMVFVQLTSPGEAHLLALLHCYCSPAEDGNIYDINNAMCLANYNRAGYEVPFQRMAMAYIREKPVFELVDTEALSSAVWVQEDFDNKDIFWFIRKSK